ncbi:hypothetical protein ETAA8_68320 [Anatilimnocola aggregata]|uniref:DUF1501 domain-containing protein n=1 Tax=Anatilimnocola aggregata TaxID=2528021 RepID=A0A517YN83_9BACT|nr:DUF1501 domain-containing protein [Anatilimnocola aggregata]QDU31672.1 hypothetical protein ETAA8_68320 [Anatilimnocola aggregata]
MLTLLGQQRRLCDGLPRRDFLKIGSLGLGGLALPQMLQAEAAAGVGRSHKSVIMIYLSGGPPHQDMFDLKPDAPVEVRGEFQPISTNVPGIQICEHMPRIAAMMDKFVAIRSLVGAQGGHSSIQCATGHAPQGAPRGGWPSIGAVVSKVQGPLNPTIPPAVDVSQKMAHDPYNIPGPGFLGLAHTPFRPDNETLANMSLHQDVTMDRLGDRKNLLLGLDRLRQQAAAADQRGLDPFVEQAMGVLTSNSLMQALDLTREDPKIRARYGEDDLNALGPALGRLGYGALMSRFLTARRLVEAGARLVTCSFADFDWHGKNFDHGRKVLPLLDQGVSALVQDLHERGLDRDVTVIVWGEFGRTPKINDKGGRDHWPGVACALLAGGGLRTGQVIGSTDATASEAVDRPVQFQEVFATLYHNLGINLDATTMTDLSGRPQYLVDHTAPLRELI